MSITITVPNDDHVALRAMAKALEEIAVARGAPGKTDILKTSGGYHPVNIADVMAYDTQTKKVSHHTYPVDQYVHMYNEDTDSYGLAQSDDRVAEFESEGYVRHTEEQYEAWKPRKGVEEDTTEQQVESLTQKMQDASYDLLVSSDCKIPHTSDGHNIFTDIVREQSAPYVTNTDSTGTAWDERIHASSKALNGDGTWRVRRKPKDMDETEWVAHVEAVKVELDRLCKDEGCDHHGTPHECVSVEPPVTPTGDDFHTDAGVVTEQQIVAIPPVAPPVPDSEAAPHGNEFAHMTFPQVMTWLTSRSGKLTVEDVNLACQRNGVENVGELAKKPELIGAFMADLRDMLGE